MGSPVWDDEKKEKMLKLALNHTEAVAIVFDKSLPIAQITAKILIVCGKYDAAENECYRTLQIENPGDPHSDDLPVGSTPGHQASERISYLQLQIRRLQQTVVSAAMYHLGFLKEKTIDTLLSCPAENLLKHYEGTDHSHTISEALDHFRDLQSWNPLICPVEDCILFSTDADKFLYHILDYHFHISSKKLLANCDSFRNSTKTSRGYGTHDVISFCEKTETFCFNNMEAMFYSFISVSNRERVKSVDEMRLKLCTDGNIALQSLQRVLLSIKDKNESEVQGELDLLENLFDQLIEASTFDYRKAIVPLLASIQRGEVKQFLDKDTNSAHGSHYRSVADAVFFDAPGILDLMLESDKDTRQSIPRM